MIRINLHYGPPTHLVRDINKFEINSLAHLACPSLFSTEVTNTKKPAIQESPQSQSSAVIRELLSKDASTTERLSSENVTSRFCNYFSIIPSHHAGKCILSILELNWLNANLKICQKTIQVLAVVLEG